MKATDKLRELGQSIWLDNITRPMLREVLRSYIDDLSVTGLTSNPSIFEKAVGDGDAYDEQIAEVADDAETEGIGVDVDERVFFELAVADLRDATELFWEVYHRTDGVDGFCSLEVSPLLADDPDATIEQARSLHAMADRENLFVKIPGTSRGLGAIEESIFAGIPINVTLLFDHHQYLAAADAYMKGIERRVEAGLNPHVSSVASLFISRWDVAVADEVPGELKNRLGIAVGGRCYRTYAEMLASDRFRRLQNEGARAQRLLWASTGTKDPEAPETMYVEAFAAPFTVDTMPEPTLRAFAEHGEVGDPLPADGGDSEEVLGEFARAGVEADALARRLQDEGKDSFAGAWKGLLETISEKRRNSGS